MDNTTPSLNALGDLHGTDKRRDIHNYLDIYERALRPDKDQVSSVLEVGVKHGASLRIWHDFFPQAQITGVDIKPAARKHEAGRIAIRIADQSDSPALRRIAKERGPFDLIVDDGSHIWAHQISTFRALFPFLKPGGLFIIEDLHTSYGRFIPKYAGEAGGQKASDYVLGLADRTIGRGVFVEPEPANRIDRILAFQIETISFARGAALIRKRRDTAAEATQDPEADPT
jgi:hypothetical protein